MIEFMKSHYYDPYLAQYVHPKKEFKVKLKDTDKDFVFDATEADLNKFDKIIDAGVTVLKLEGRGRSADYVHVVTSCYNEAIDAYLEGTYTHEKVEGWK